MTSAFSCIYNMIIFCVFPALKIRAYLIWVNSVVTNVYNQLALSFIMFQFDTLSWNLNY